MGSRPVTAGRTLSVSGQQMNLAWGRCGTSLGKVVGKAPAEAMGIHRVQRVKAPGLRGKWQVMSVLNRCEWKIVNGIPGAGMRSRDEPSLKRRGRPGRRHDPGNGSCSGDDPSGTSLD